MSARTRRGHEPTLFELEAPTSTPAGDSEDQVVSTGTFARVALNRPMHCEFTYIVPERLVDRAVAGARVAVPFRGRREVGVCVALETSSQVPASKLRALFDVLDQEPVVDGALLDLTRWIAERYAASWGEALAAVLPAPLKRERGVRKLLVARPVEGIGTAELQELEESSPKQHRFLRTLLEIGQPVELRDLLRRLNLSDSPAKTLARRGWIVLEKIAARPDPLAARGAHRPRPAQLSPAQEIAVQAVTAALEERRFAPYLLQGVTGSGKTEVYLRAIEHALGQGRSAIVLVPEIALTPQTVGWFRSRFDDVAVLHSRMTDSQRLEMWMRLKRGEARVVVGARSAIFAPVSDLGVVVVDEEHEPSFKQASVPRYHARDVALERARSAGAVCLLGSATPSLETWSRARSGALDVLRLPERVGGGALPQVHVVDMRLEGERGDGLFSRLLETFLRETHAAGEQTILFLNRRGFVPVLWCPACERTVRCDQCDVSLTHHRRIQQLVCHSCCEERTIPPACPTCSQPRLRFLGVGSERVEAELARILPEARVRRMDSDTMLRPEDYEETLDAFGRGDLDVLVGTQMIAKGLDFPRVTLVGIVSADLTLHLPDFRAAERAYQLIAQVAGRAGRSDLAGRIVVQTRNPEHPAIRLATRDSFDAFAKQEVALRAELSYPPHARLLRLVFEDEDEARCGRVAAEVTTAVRELLVDRPLTLLGPSPAPLSRLRGRFRQHALLKAPADGPHFEALTPAIWERIPSGPTRVLIDVDPMSML